MAAAARPGTTEGARTHCYQQLGSTIPTTGVRLRGAEDDGNDDKSMSLHNATMDKEPGAGAASSLWTILAALALPLIFNTLLEQSQSALVN